MVKGAGMSKPCPSTIQQRSRLQQFRQAIYARVFTQARDALFELLEALLVHPCVASFAELCLAPVFRRQWPSLYAALRDGRLDLDALEQLLTAQVPAASQTVIAADGSYGNHRFLGPLKGQPCCVVARLRRDRVLYRAAPPYGGRGRPAKHGKRFAFKDPTTWGEPDETTEGEDTRWGRVRLRRWNGLHAREDAATAFDVVQIESHRERERPPAPLWVACLGGRAATVTQIWHWYDHRWSIEPAIEFRKQRLHWTRPRLRDPERCDRWPTLVTLAHWALYLARDLVADRPLPWQ